MPRKVDYLQAFIPCLAGCWRRYPGMARDDIVAGGILVHDIKECPLYARAFLVDGIVQGIGQMLDALLYLRQVHHPRRLAIPLPQLILIVGKILELDSLWMVEKQEINRLVHWLKVNLHIP